ncbi:hypothetical protein Hanom_Chr04g00336661 [Helianthus anomalus]
MVMWHPTKQTKNVPLLKELPNNSLKDLQFWMYDPVTGQVVIVCATKEYRTAGVKDLIRFGENDIKLLGRHRSEVILSMKSVLRTSQLRLHRLHCSSYGMDNDQEWILNYLVLMLEESYLIPRRSKRRNSSEA